MMAKISIEVPVEDVRMGKIEWPSGMRTSWYGGQRRNGTAWLAVHAESVEQMGRAVEIALRGLRHNG